MKQNVIMKVAVAVAQECRSERNLSESSGGKGDERV